MMNEMTIVIADDDSDLVNALRKRCEKIGLHVRTAFDALDALNVIHESEPDLICLDVNMPCGNGLSVLEMIASDEYLRSTPVIILTGESNEETIRRCHLYCAYYVEKCSDIWPRIEPILRELLGRSDAMGDRARCLAGTSVSHRLAAAKPRDDNSSSGPLSALSFGSTAQPEITHEIPMARNEAEQSMTMQFETTTASDGQAIVDIASQLLSGGETFGDGAAELPWVHCIDDDADYSNALKLRLERYGIAVVRAFEGMEGYRSAFTRPADVILLDYEMSNGRGDYILSRLKDNSVTKDIPVIVITGRKDRTLERKMLNLGAATFMHKPLEFESLLGELRKYIDVLSRPADVPKSGPLWNSHV